MAKADWTAAKVVVSRAFGLYNTARIETENATIGDKNRVVDTHVNFVAAHDTCTQLAEVMHQAQSQWRQTSDGTRRD